MSRPQMSKRDKAEREARRRAAIAQRTRDNELRRKWAQHKLNPGDVDLIRRTRQQLEPDGSPALVDAYVLRMRNRSMTFTQIAAALNVSRQAAFKRYTRALERAASSAPSGQ